MAFHIRRSVSGGQTYALLSDSDRVDTAVIYVHGFLGDALSTWEHLQYWVDRLPGEPFRKVDLFFYDYPAEEDFVQVRDGATTITRLEAPFLHFIVASSSQVAGSA
jgi:hypothetical protein